MIRLPFIILLLFALISCNHGNKRVPPRGIISKDTMSQLVAEVYVLNAVDLHREARKNAYHDLVELDLNNLLDSFGIDRKVFEASLEWYHEDPEDAAEIYDEALNILSERLALYKPREKKKLPDSESTSLESEMKRGELEALPPAMRAVMLERQNQDSASD
ncbi:MAG: hypothetical protein Kow0075_14660 [Salibacteraceae bacterium]